MPTRGDELGGRRGGAGRWLLASFLPAAVAGCSSVTPEPVEQERPPSSLDRPAPAPTQAGPTRSALPEPARERAAADGPCPEEMVYVDAVHCPDTPEVRVGLRCIRKDPQQNPNNLTICYEFAPGQSCSVPERRQRYCIDRYEHPSKEGAHPPVMVSAYDAAALCAEQGKRMCWESEWTAACEGPERKPFPYGQVRSKEHCNIDNPWIGPNLDRVHHPDDAVRGPEIIRLDQSVPSGAMVNCQSDFGVFDLTGNFDEWVLTEWPRGKSKWAGLKGGAWGHVRNACRPITTSHVAHWSYYFISFRCCKDPVAATLAPPPGEGPPLFEPPPWSPPAHPAGRPLDRGFTPAVRGPNQPVVPRP